MLWGSSMPKIPLSPPMRDTDELAHTQGLTEAIDFVLDQVEGGFALSKRPGLWAWWRADELEGVGVDGVYWWSPKSLLIVVVGGRVYAFSRPDAAPTEVTSDLVRMHIGQQVSFSTNGCWLLMCNGGPIMAWDGVNAAINLADPRHSDSLAFLNGVFVSNDQGTNNVRFTAPLLETETTTPEFLPYSFTPDASPDKLLAIHSGWSELLLFGPRSVEIWAYTGASESAPFQRLSGAYIERGLGAKDSVVQADNKWFWLDHEGKFVESNGRSVSVVSSAFDRAIRNLVRFDDAKAFVVFRRFICLVFPAADVCFVLDLYNRGWTKWAWWNTEMGYYERFLGQCAEFVPDWNTQFVGCRKSGRVGIMHHNLVTDFYNPIRAKAVTAHMDFGTMKVKQSRELLLRLKRGF